MYVCMYDDDDMYVCTYGLIFLTYSTSLEAQKLVIFGLQLCLIIHKKCRGPWNLVLMILENTSTHNSHFVGKSLSSHFVIILDEDMKFVFAMIFHVQNLITLDNPISMWLWWIWNSRFWLGVINLKKYREYE